MHRAIDKNPLVPLTRVSMADLPLREAHTPIVLKKFRKVICALDADLSIIIDSRFDVFNMFVKLEASVTRQCYS